MQFEDEDDNETFNVDDDISFLTDGGNDMPLPKRKRSLSDEGDQPQLSLVRNVETGELLPRLFPNYRSLPDQKVEALQTVFTEFQQSLDL